LRAQAEQQPETEVRGAIGAEHDVSVVNVVVEMVGNELFVAFPARVFPGQLVLVLAAFAPEAEWTDWHEVAALPTRPLTAAELCYSVAFLDE
jgi:hypothetical protein